MNPMIGRRSFLAVFALTGFSFATSLSWAEPAHATSLTAGHIASEDSSCADEITDDYIAEIVASLPESNRLLRAQALSINGGGTTTYAGETLYETAVEQVKASYPNGVKTAIIAGPDQAWIDALSAAGLAGALDAPILFSEKNRMNTSTMKALKSLGVEKILIVGGPLAVGDGAVTDLKTNGFKNIERLYGKEYVDTQLAIFNYGMKHKLWNKDLIILATGSGFADALSVSPVAFALKAPIFVADTNNGLTVAQKAAWGNAASQGYGKRVAIVGGYLVVNEGARNFANSMCGVAGGSGKAEWIWGQTQYDTSAKIAEWATGGTEYPGFGFTWDMAAFTTGYEPWDALAGSVLQGKTKSVLLLANNPNEATIAQAAKHKGRINSIRFFGGYLAMPMNVRTSVTSLLSDRVRSESTGVSYVRMLELEVANSRGYQNYSSSEIAASMNPANFGYGDSGYYQFALVNGGYSGKVSAAQLNSFIATNGSDGMLAGRGQDFIDAAKQYGTNEVYLLAHAILESGWGKSRLAMGNNVNGTTYYNFFGIGAYDSNPLGSGALSASNNGWSTPRNAILGAAYWIKNNYHANAYNQNTLYKMRWNYAQAARQGVVWKQYATGRTWATGIASVMASCYSYCGLNMSNCGLTFLVPEYS